MCETGKLILHVLGLIKTKEGIQDTMGSYGPSLLEGNHIDACCSIIKPTISALLRLEVTCEQ